MNHHQILEFETYLGALKLIITMIEHLSVKKLFPGHHAIDRTHL